MSARFTGASTGSAPGSGRRSIPSTRRPRRSASAETYGNHGQSAATSFVADAPRSEQRGQVLRPSPAVNTPRIRCLARLPYIVVRVVLPLILVGRCWPSLDEQLV